jgi:hypothetical protein
VTPQVICGGFEFSAQNQRPMAPELLSGLLVDRVLSGGDRVGGEAQPEERIVDAESAELRKSQSPGPGFATIASVQVRRRKTSSSELPN